MGLLAALDLHKQIEAGVSLGDYHVIEYQLISWGEIFPPFLGDREHSINARYILGDFPFKLFSMSTPYSGLPQRLCLTFRAPMEVKKDTGKFHLYGIFPDEIAKEFAAFLSIVTRRRIFAVGQIRYDGLPLEQEAELYQRSHFQEKQRLKEIKPPEIYNLLENLQAMDRRIVQGLILAMRLYHSAIEMIYTEPEFSYLFLVTCLEAISSVVYHEYKLSDEGDHPTELAIHGMEQADRSLATRNQFTAKKMLVHNEGFIFQKLFRFVAENVPKVFWTETEDDAKPDYLTAVIFPSSEGVGKEYISHSDITIQPWERIEEAHLKSCLRDIYKARSKLIHEGIQFPESIVVGHFRSVPVEAVEEMGHPLIPPLITFERLVSYSIREFLHRQKA